MMKRVRNGLITGLFVMILAAFGMMPQVMQHLPGDAGADAAYADTTYTVFIYSGKEGYFGKPGTTVKKITGLKYGEEVTVSLSDLDLKVKDPDEYYVRGLKIAGHDNDELSSLKYRSYTFEIKEDTSFSVSYGMAGGMVKYTVYHEDRDGNELYESEEFYGMAGDKPVVACRIIEGYLPDDINLAKTLSSNEDENVFTFTYHRVYDGSGSNEDEDADEDDDSGDNAAGTGNRNAANGSGANGTNTANAGDGNNAPGENITDLDEGETPLTNIEDEESPKGGPFSGVTGLMAGIVGAGILIALLLLYLVLRKRKGEEE